VVLLVLLLCQFPIGNAHADDGGEYTGLDILFLVDQSGSMGGEGAGGLDHPVPNDPLGLRFYATSYAMRWLGADRLQVHEDVTFRMAVVHFGSRTQVETFPSASGSGHWQEIAPGSDEEWVPLRSELEDVLEAGEFERSNLGNTNHLVAFRAAEQVFGELPEDSSRRRAIVVLTDGQPYVDTDGFTVAGHLRSVQEYVENNFSYPDYTVYTVAMNDSRDNYWPRTQSYWEDITDGRANKVTTNDDVGTRFREILLELTEGFPTGVSVVDEVIVPGDVVVPPYLESVAFTFFMSNPGEQPVVTVDGEVLEPRGDVTFEGSGGPIQTIRVLSPDPGLWNVAVDPPDTGVDISMRWIVAQGRLDSPQGAQPQYIPLDIQYSIIDALGQPLQEYEDPRYRLRVTAQVEAAGQIWPIELEQQPSNTYLGEFTPVETGQHKIHVYAESQDINGNQVVVYDADIGDGFIVEPAYFVFEELPESWPQYKPLTLTYELQDTSGWPISGIPPLEARVTVTDSEGGSEMLELERQEDSTYSAVHTPQQDGESTVSVIAQVRDANGDVYTVVDEETGSFDVTHTRLVSMEIVEPTETQQNNTTLLPWVRNPLLLEVQLVDETGAPVDARDAFVSQPSQAVTVSVLDEESNEQPGVLILELTDSPGLYRAKTTELGRGEYQLTVSADADLEEGFLLGEEEEVIQVTRVIHPAHLPIAASLAGLLVLGTLVVLGVHRRQQALAVHPAEGRLFIVNEFGDRRFSMTLDTFERNQITLKKRDLEKQGMHPATHVTRLDIACRSEADHKIGRINVNVYLDGEKNPSITRTIAPRGEIKLGGYRFWLLKDPDDEQFRDRSEDMLF
jgi:hypothetical protein